MYKSLVFKGPLGKFHQLSALKHLEPTYLFIYLFINCFVTPYFLFRLS